jgi:hypothetical protein
VSGSSAAAWLSRGSFRLVLPRRSDESVVAFLFAGWWCVSALARGSKCSSNRDAGDGRAACCVLWRGLLEGGVPAVSLVCGPGGASGVCGTRRGVLGWSSALCAPRVFVNENGASRWVLEVWSCAGVRLAECAGCFGSTPRRVLGPKRAVLGRSGRARPFADMRGCLRCAMLLGIRSVYRHEVHQDSRASVARVARGRHGRVSVGVGGTGAFRVYRRIRSRLDVKRGMLKFTSGGTGNEHTVKPALSGSAVFTFGAFSLPCTGAQATGKATSLTENVLTIKFTGCKNQGGNNCETAGAPNDTTIEAPLSGKIVSVGSGSSLKAGLLLAFRNARGANLLTISCSGTAVKWYGSVIGSIGPEDATELSLVTTFKVNGGVQDIEETNSLRAVFGGGATTKMTLEGVTLLDFALKVEVMG